MLYIITDGTNYKLGYSQNPEARLKSLQTSNPKPLILLGFTKGGLEDEARYHKLLNNTKLVGEWFNASPKLFEILSSWLAFKPILAPSLETSPKSYDQLSKIEVHITSANNYWFSVQDCAKLLGINRSSLSRRKNLTTKLFFCALKIKKLFLNEASFKLIFYNNSSILAELNQYKVTEKESCVK